MREIVLDTETTGLSPQDGHRIVEVGCIELINHFPTGQFYHQYINPKRPIPPEATAISGLTNTFLADFPVFSEIAPDFLAFLQDSPLIIHNASFDMKFINYEVKNIDYPEIANPIICTLQLSRKKFPGSPASLDALCRRFNVDNTHRSKHGALLDSELLVEVYQHLLGLKKKSLIEETSFVKSGESPVVFDKVSFPVRTFSLSPQEAHIHEAFIDKKLKNSLWKLT